MMPLGPSTSSAKMQTKRSCWTPLNHPLANSKVFEERRSLLRKWFAGWSDDQKKAVLQDFVQNCSVEQLRFLNVNVSKQLPLQSADFTCLLPRAICLYLFSFLDPRSLCRCAQVSWHWRSIVELDQLWMPKCLKLNWCISFSPSPFEQGVWKRLYIQSVEELRLGLQQTQQQLQVPDVPEVVTAHEEKIEFTPSRKERPSYTSCASRKKQASDLPPWRDADRCPKDTIRFNFLSNMNPTEQAERMQARGRTCTSKMEDERRKTVSEATYKLRKAKSLMFLSSKSHPSPLHEPQHLKPETRPSWAARSQYNPITQETAVSLLSLNQQDAGVRPRPVRMAVPRLSTAVLKASQRSHRTPPSVPLFENWPALYKK